MQIYCSFRVFKSKTKTETKAKIKKKKNSQKFIENPTKTRIELNPLN